MPSELALVIRSCTPLRLRVLDVVFLAALLAGILLAPLTKVEESFPLQAAHDALHHGLQVHEYDHLVYPGVVPRSFIGPLWVAVYTLPLALGVRAWWGTADSNGGVPGSASPPKFVYQYAVRATLAFLVTCSFAFVRTQTRRTFGGRAATAFGVVLLSQYHTIFWGSRTLPNTFGLIVTNFALGCWIHELGVPPGAVVVANSGRERKLSLSIFGPRSSTADLAPLLPTVAPRNVNTPLIRSCILLLVTAAVILRSELAVLATLVAASLLATRRATLGFLLRTMFPTALTAVFASLAVDSFFWQQLLWPEAKVFFFNTFDNRSHEWGTQPWHWYYSVALPKILHIALPIAVVTLLFWNPTFITSSKSKQYLSRWALWQLFTPAMLYIAILSVLPHKEWRFIFYVVPIWSVIAAVGLASMADCHRRFLRISRFFIMSAFVFLIPIVLVAIAATSTNYPGGIAFSLLHRHHAAASLGLASSNVRVHIDAGAAMTGVSRFGETYSGSSVWRVRDINNFLSGMGALIAYNSNGTNWVYSKNESLEHLGDYIDFDYVLSTNPLQFLNDTISDDAKWKPIYVVKGFAGFDFKSLIKLAINAWHSNTLIHSVESVMGVSMRYFQNIYTTLSSIEWATLHPHRLRDDFESTMRARGIRFALIKHVAEPLIQALPALPSIAKLWAFADMWNQIVERIALGELQIPGLRLSDACWILENPDAPRYEGRVDSSEAKASTSIVYQSAVKLLGSSRSIVEKAPSAPITTRAPSAPSSSTSSCLSTTSSTNFSHSIKKRNTHSQSRETLRKQDKSPTSVTESESSRSSLIMPKAAYLTPTTIIQATHDTNIMQILSPQVVDEVDLPFLEDIVREDLGFSDDVEMRVGEGEASAKASEEDKRLQRIHMEL